MNAKNEMLETLNGDLEEKDHICLKLQKRIKDLEAALSETNEKRFKLQDTLESMEKELQNRAAYIDNLKMQHTGYETGTMLFSNRYLQCHEKRFDKEFDGNWHHSRISKNFRDKHYFVCDRNGFIDTFKKVNNFQNTCCQIPNYYTNSNISKRSPKLQRKFNERCNSELYDKQKFIEIVAKLSQFDDRERRKTFDLGSNALNKVNDYPGARGDDDIHPEWLQHTNNMKRKNLHETEPFWRYKQNIAYENCRRGYFDFFCSYFRWTTDSFMYKLFLWRFISSF